MTDGVNAEIISIGTEILLGELTDTNSVFLARSLRDLGINVFFMTSVGDNERRIAEVLRIACSRASIVITCGGLGPTVDDMTRQAVAMATDRQLVFHDDLLMQIAERFASFKARMTDNNRRQAFLPEGAIVIENPVGTAPAFMVEHNDNIIISLPGVPREMKYLMSERVVPGLRQRYALGIIKARTLKTAGIGESALDELLGDNLLNHANPSIGLAAHSGQIDIRITAKAATDEEADTLIAKVEAEVRERAGDHIFGAEDDLLSDIILADLKSRNRRLVTVEAGTVGVFQQLHEHSTEVVVISHSFDDPNELARTLGGDRQPTLSLRELAGAAAHHFLSLTPDADVVIAILSEPDVDEGEDKAENTVIVVQSHERVRVRSFGFGGRSEMVATWGQSWTLAAAWRLMKEGTGT